MIITFFFVFHLKKKLKISFYLFGVDKKVELQLQSNQNYMRFMRSFYKCKYIIEKNGKNIVFYSLLLHCLSSEQNTWFNS